MSVEEILLSFIYHEHQRPDSMLCAQHALNSLLQGPYFTAPDLSEIARSLDELEEGYRRDDPGLDATSSTNMDDTGFFSVQVLEKALNVWGLNLSRWRGESMRKYQNVPHTQLAFILNYEHHWYTLRRFGPAYPNPDEDYGNGHWFNLNSFLPRPEWVGKLYLGMVLQQAEADGYSVFAVTQIDRSSPLALPRVKADEIATLYLDNDSRSKVASWSGSIAQFIDRDPELQAALQASITEKSHDIDSSQPTQQVTEGNPTSSNMNTSYSPREFVGLDTERAIFHQSTFRNQSSLDEERVYDDEDGELQAALKASLEEQPGHLFNPTITSAKVANNTDVQNTASEEVSEEGTDTPALEEEAITLEELRKKRLARFSGE